MEWIFHFDIFYSMYIWLALSTERALFTIIFFFSSLTIQWNFIQIKWCFALLFPLPIDIQLLSLLNWFFLPLPSFFWFCYLFIPSFSWASLGSRVSNYGEKSINMKCDTYMNHSQSVWLITWSFLFLSTAFVNACRFDLRTAINILFAFYICVSRIGDNNNFNRIESNKCINIQFSICLGYVQYTTSNQIAFKIGMLDLVYDVHFNQMSACVLCACV